MAWICITKSISHHKMVLTSVLTIVGISLVIAVALVGVATPERNNLHSVLVNQSLLDTWIVYINDDSSKVMISSLDGSKSFELADLPASRRGNRVVLLPASCGPESATDGFVEIPPKAGGIWNIWICSDGDSAPFRIERAVCSLGSVADLWQYQSNEFSVSMQGRARFLESFAKFPQILPDQEPWTLAVGERKIALSEMNDTHSQSILADVDLYDGIVSAIRVSDRAVVAELGDGRIVLLNAIDQKVRVIARGSGVAVCRGWNGDTNVK